MPPRFESTDQAEGMMPVLERVRPEPRWPGIHHRSHPTTGVSRSRQPGSELGGVQASVEPPAERVVADGDGEADIHLAADDDQGVGIEAAVGPHRELSPGPSRRTRPTVSRRKWAAPRAVLARPSRSRDIGTSPVPAAMASSG